jgi:hypothetical protein
MQPKTNTTARLCAFAISLVAFLAPAVSGAQEDFAEATRAIATKSRLMANYGLFSAIGEIGGTYTYAPVPELQMEFGAGIGLSGLQFSFMPKLSVGDRENRFILGAGPSMGVDPDNNPSHTYVSYWLNAEIGYEYRSLSGFSFMIAVGITRGIAGEYRNQCVIDCDGDTKGSSRPTTDIPLLPQGRIAFGRWF